MTPSKLIFTISHKGEAVSIVCASNAEAAVLIAEHMLEFSGPDHDELRARVATAIERNRFFEDACAWSEDVSLAGILLDRPLTQLH